MKIKLPASVLETLPAPDDQGIIRVTVGLKVSRDGEATLAELNDSPMPGDDDDEAAEPAGESEESEGEEMPSPESVGQSMY